MIFNRIQILFLSTLVAMLLYSCEPDTSNPYEIQYSLPLELRQLVQQEDTQKESSGYYFLVGGGYDSYENKITVIKAFAKVDGKYRFIQMPIEDIRIEIDSTFQKPIVRLKYFSRVKVSPDELLSDDYAHIIYEIVCPERLLPEKLLPINL